jgi:hypothetical protein
MAVKFSGDGYIVLPPILSGKRTFTVNMLLSTDDTQANNANYNNIAYFIGGANSYSFNIGINGGYLEEHNTISEDRRDQPIKTSYNINDGKTIV